MPGSLVVSVEARQRTGRVRLAFDASRTAAPGRSAIGRTAWTWSEDAMVVANGRGAGVVVVERGA